MYNKICKDPRCRKPFQSESRNQAYCSPECQKRHSIEKQKRRKVARSSTYENHIVTRAYQLANDIADIFYPEHICARCGAESAHVHHIDGNILNNQPTNLVRLCVKCHKEAHSSMPRVNMNVLLKECREMKEENPSTDVVKMFVSKFDSRD